MLVHCILDHLEIISAVKNGAEACNVLYNALTSALCNICSHLVFSIPFIFQLVFHVAS